MRLKPLPFTAGKDSAAGGARSQCPQSVPAGGARFKKTCNLKKQVGYIGMVSAKTKLVRTGRHSPHEPVKGT